MRSTSILKTLGVTVAISLAASSIVVAQNVEAIPVAPEPDASAKNLSEVEGVSSQSPITESIDDAALIPELHGIVVEEIGSGGKSAATQVILEIHGNEAPAGDAPTEAIAERLSPYLGESLSMKKIALLRIALTDSWRKATGEVIRVAVPPQDITEGTLTLQIVRAQLGAIDVRGASYFEPVDYLNEMSLSSRETIDIDVLTDDIDWLERNPYRNVGAILQRGDSFGETDILLNVQEQRPWQVFAGYDREGTELLGEDRWFFGGNHGNLFGKGHRVAYQYFTDIEFANQHGHFVSYLIPLPWRHELQVSGFYSESNVSTASGLTVPGLETINSSDESWQTGIDYIMPLRRFKGSEHDLVFGFDTKSSDSNLDFGELSLFETSTETYQFRGEWRLRRYGRRTALSVHTRVVASPGNWSSSNSDEAYEASRSGADSSYVYGDLDIDLQTNLPAGFTLMTGAAYHTSSTNQLASEQMILSGNGAVRGFERSRIRADEGLLLNIQLNAPAIGGEFFGGQGFVQPFTFFDYGTGRSIDQLPGEPDDVHLSSAGIGFNAELNKRISVGVTYAWQIAESGFDDGEGGRWHIGVTTKW